MIDEALMVLNILLYMVGGSAPARPLSNFTKGKARRHRSSEQVSAREVFPQKPITINDPALYLEGTIGRLEPARQRWIPMASR